MSRIISWPRASAGTPLTTLQVSQLVYLAHGCSLALLGQPLLRDRDKVEALNYGPMIPSVFDAFKRFGNNAIVRLDSTTDTARGAPASATGSVANAIFGFWLRPTEPDVARGGTPASRPFSDQEITLMERVWEVYGGLSGGQLLAITHAAGTPARNLSRNSAVGATVIDPQSIKDYFLAEIEKNCDKPSPLAYNSVIYPI